MNKKLSDGVEVRVRSRLLNGYGGDAPRNHHEIFTRRGKLQPVCVEQLARFATDNSYCGFEDPRSAALFVASSSDYKLDCQRVGCNGLVKINHLGESYDQIRECSGFASCLQDDVDTMKRYDEQGIEMEDPLANYPSVPSSEHIGWLCMDLTCNFSFGYTFTSEGSAGVCAKKNFPASE